MIGIFPIIVAAASFATSPIFARIAYDAGANPNTFLFIRFAITTAVIYSAYFTFGSLSIRKAGPVASSAVIFITVTIVYGVLMTIQSFKLPTTLSGWTAIILCALFSTVFGIICLYEGLKRVDPANTAIISTLEVVVAAALAILILGETMSLSKILGACMIIFAVIILGKSEYKTARVRIQ